MLDKVLVPNQTFAKLASDEQITRATRALEANGIQVLIAKNGEEAKRLFFELVPDGSEIFLGASVTLEKLGITAEVDKSGRFDALRPKMFAMNRATQGREIRKLVGGPDFAAGSVHAVTEDGQVMIASNTGSQLGPYATSAGSVIWVVGAQKYGNPDLVLPADFDAQREQYYTTLNLPLSPTVFIERLKVALSEALYRLNKTLPRPRRSAWTHCARGRSTLGGRSWREARMCCSAARRTRTSRTFGRACGRCAPSSRSSRGASSPPPSSGSWKGCWRESWRREKQSPRLRDGPKRMPSSATGGGWAAALPLA